MKRRNFLTALGSVFAAALGVSTGDARADQGQGPMNQEFYGYGFPTRADVVQDMMAERAGLEAGAGVEPAMNGHEPPALPLGYPADDHSSTK